MKLEGVLLWLYLTEDVMEHSGDNQLHVVIYPEHGVNVGESLRS